MEDSRAQLRERGMNGTQVTVVALCVVINMLDGFDILAASLVAPRLAEEWGLGPVAIGTLLSAGPAGMAAGALLLSPVADIHGRRRALVMCLTLMSVGMLASAFSTSVEGLSALRFVTGMGVGAMASCTGTMVVEFANARRKDLGLGLVTAGYPFGLVAGGALAVWLIGGFGWRSVFLAGGAASALLIPVVMAAMPESIDFLLARRPRNTLARVNRVLARLDLPPAGALPPPGHAGGAASQLADLLRPPIRQRFAAMAATYFLYMTSSYFILNWATTLTTQSGASLAGGISISIMINMGGVAGALLIGVACLPFGRARATVAATLLLGGAIFLFGFQGDNPGFAALFAPLIGFGIFGAAMGLYATAASAFPAEVRATGIGLAMSAGRLGAVVGPYLGGVILAGGMGRAGVCILLAMPALAAAHMITRVGKARPAPAAQAQG